MSKKSPPPSEADCQTGHLQTNQETKAQIDHQCGSNLSQTNEGWQCNECPRKGDWYSCPKCGEGMLQPEDPLTGVPDSRQCHECFFELVVSPGVMPPDPPLRGRFKTADGKSVYVVTPPPTEAEGNVTKTDRKWFVDSRLWRYREAEKVRKIEEAKRSGNLNELSRHPKLVDQFYHECYEKAKAGEGWAYVREYLEQFPHLALKAKWMAPIIPYIPQFVSRQSALKSNRGRPKSQEKEDLVKELSAARNDGCTSAEEIIEFLARKNAPLISGWRKNYKIRSWKDVQSRIATDKVMLKAAGRYFSKN